MIEIIIVFGRFVVELAAFTETLPKRGETVFGKVIQMGLGRKGSNQGVAAAKAGSNAIMVFPFNTIWVS